MTNYAAGHAAEKRAADYLKKRGFKIVQLNWKTKWCEIDIIAEKAEVMYLIEVKYRSSPAYGRGLDYVTPSKLRQMKFAAELWMSNQNQEAAYQLAAIGIDGDEIQFVEIFD